MTLLPGVGDRLFEVFFKMGCLTGRELNLALDIRDSLPSDATMILGLVLPTVDLTVDLSLLLFVLDILLFLMGVPFLTVALATVFRLPANGGEFDSSLLVIDSLVEFLRYLFDEGLLSEDISAYIFYLSFLSFSFSNSRNLSLVNYFIIVSL